MARVLESIPTGGGDLDITLSAQPSEIRIAASSRRPDPSTASPAASAFLPERESGITVEMARALIAALGGQLIEESTAGPELALTILLPRM
jgi:hypothetical protein